MQTKAAASAVKVLLVEDHPMFRERLAYLIEKPGNMTVCAEADTVQAAIAVAEEKQPDIAIVDITLRDSNGLDFLKDLKARRLEIPVLVLSMHDEAIYAERALRAGARGYISKDQASSEVMAAIERVMNGEIYLSRQMTSRMLGRFTAGRNAAEADESSLLTDREFDVYQRIGRGESTGKIASDLRVAPTTVDTYRARIKEKLGLKSGTELQRRAMEWCRQHPA